jgi:hypothetical protein
MIAAIGRYTFYGGNFTFWQKYRIFAMQYEI